LVEKNAYYSCCEIIIFIQPQSLEGSRVPAICVRASETRLFLVLTGLTLLLLLFGRSTLCSWPLGDSRGQKGTFRAVNSKITQCARKWWPLSGEASAASSGLNLDEEVLAWGEKSYHYSPAKPGDVIGSVHSATA